MRTMRGRQPTWGAGGVLALALGVVMVRDAAQGQQAQPPAGGRGGPTRALSDPVVTDRAIQGGIDLHAHQDPDSNGPSYGQAARSIDALDLVGRARKAGMRG